MLTLSQLNGFNAGRTPYILYAVATGRNAASPDGINWTEVFPSILLTASGNTSRQVLCANNLWFGNNGGYVTQDVQTSGTITTTGLSPTITDIAFGAGLFVAVGLASGGFKASYGATLNGTYTLVSLTGSAGGGSGSGVDFVNGLFIAVSSDGYISTSSNGSTWNLRYSGIWTGGQVNKTIDYGNGAYCVNGSASTNGEYIYSADGVTWASKIIPSLGGAVSSIIYWKGTWYAFDSGSKVATTTTPATAASWTVTSTTFAGLTAIQGVSSTVNKLILFGNGTSSSPKISWSLDGINWTASVISSVLGAPVQSVAYQRT